MSKRLFPATVATLMLLVIGCSGEAWFSPSFLNLLGGSVVPLTPGAATDFVLVRCVNRTANPIEFIVTLEREVVSDADVGESDAGGEQADAPAQLEAKTFELQTFPGGAANEIGILLDCPVTRVGLGEDLNFPTEEPGLFIGTTEDQLIQGYGVPGNVYPLDARVGNFACGDTLIFEVATALGVPGNVRVTTYVLAAADQPDTFSGPDTFGNARVFLEREFRQEE
jgi:hypothetical protein